MTRSPEPPSTSAAPLAGEKRTRLRVSLSGAVQGVGFRPFVFRLARELALDGWVRNDTRGIELEVEGPAAALERFVVRLGAEAPPPSSVHARTLEWLAPTGAAGFEIRHEGGGGEHTVVLLPDLATCPECLDEIRDPASARHAYPFTNCTNCGPRFSILRDVPYDRPNTTMRGFALCARCSREYGDPGDRRFHAQPIACPACGPHLVLTDADGAVRGRAGEALAAAVAMLREGGIVAVKGVGGYQILCDAANDDAVGELRVRKQRPSKPFALLVADLALARALCTVDEAAARVLGSPECPIVLLPRRSDRGTTMPVSRAVAPWQPDLGLMLPAAPLHHLLAGAFGRALVATSGNRADEPIAIDDHDARERLGTIADAFLAHDRPIERHVDDSVGRFIAGEFRLLRRARGYAPRPVRVHGDWPVILAVGAHQKNTIALAHGDQVVVSQHIGDLQTLEASAAFERVIADLLRLYDLHPAILAHDMHPDYLSSQWAERHGHGFGVPRVAVQHHHAHLASCLAENGAPGAALGVIWDGSGQGPDGTVWGGEFLRGDAAGVERVAHLRTFALPGGEAAVKRPRLSAIGLLRETFGPGWLGRTDLAPVRNSGPDRCPTYERMLAEGVGSPRTSSAGRLFDALAAFLELDRDGSYEGQAAMRLEAAADPDERGAYPLALRARAGAPIVIDWAPLVLALLEDLSRGVAVERIAARAHRGLVGAIVGVAARIGEPRVALSGGCFQNRRLTELAHEALRRAGHEVLLHRLVPPNDGGVSLGQAAVAAARVTRAGIAPPARKGD